MSIGLEHFKDLQIPVSVAEARQVLDVLTKRVEASDGQLEVELVGKHRRQEVGNDVEFLVFSRGLHSSVLFG